VILNYKLAEFLHDDFTKKQEVYAGEYTSKRQSFEKDAASFQENCNAEDFSVNKVLLENGTGWLAWNRKF
jgi:outer membrane protein